MFTPRVSVLIPTYNNAHFLDDAIQSVLDQTFTDYELVIVDNCSTDDTEQVVGKYLGDKRISYYKNDHNLGLVGNWNKCLEYAKGEYIKFLCSDDKFHPQLLEKFVPIMDQYPNVSLVTSYRNAFGEKSKLFRTPFSGLHSGQEVIHECLNDGRGNLIGEPTTVMFRKSDVKIIGGFRPKFKCLVDLDLWLRLAAVGDLFLVPESLSFFRIHETQASKTVTQNFDFTFEEYLFYKSVKETNDYKTDLITLNLDNVIKKRATYCADTVFKIIPKLHKQSNYKLFMKAVKIAYQENVFANSILKILKHPKVRTSFTS